ncbi:STAS/SEC14 domain-containing protein [bacterium]|nr:STAS/SEC14 domain-containing protein [bacterium]
MAVAVTEAEDGVVEVAVTGSLTRSDYDHFVPVLERKMKDGKVKILFSMHDFTGWDIGALWEDIKFDFKHFGDIERLAMVGEKKWEEGMAWFCKPFTTAKVAYFDQGQIDTARSWLRGE